MADASKDAPKDVLLPSLHPCILAVKERQRLSHQDPERAARRGDIDAGEAEEADDVLVLDDVVVGCEGVGDAADHDVDVRQGGDLAARHRVLRRLQRERLGTHQLGDLLDLPAEGGCWSVLCCMHTLLAAHESGAGALADLAPTQWHMHTGCLSLSVCVAKGGMGGDHGRWAGEDGGAGVEDELGVVRNRGGPRAIDESSVILLTLSLSSC